jgi:hypothetical protein
MITSLASKFHDFTEMFSIITPRAFFAVLIMTTFYAKMYLIGSIWLMSHSRKISGNRMELMRLTLMDSERKGEGSDAICGDDEREIERNRGNERKEL